jgi:hypothetical protein
MSPILGIYASQISGHLVTNSYYSIATQTVGSGGASSITFNSIPSTYTHLQIRFIGKIGSSTGAPSIYFNGVASGTSYAWHNLRGDGSNASANGYASQSYMSDTVSPSSIYNNSNFSVGIIDILDYANTNKNKTLRQLVGVDNNGSGALELYSGLWANTAAITQLDLFNGYVWQQYSTFSLYGIK